MRRWLSWWRTILITSGTVLVGYFGLRLHRFASRSREAAELLSTLRLSLEPAPRLATESEYMSMLAGIDPSWGPPNDSVQWIDSFPYCRGYGRRHCNIYKEDVAELRDWRARKRKLARPHQRCPRGNESRPIQVFLADLPWVDPPAMVDLDQCPVPCKGTNGLAAPVQPWADVVIVVNSKTFTYADQVRARLALEYNIDNFAAPFDMLISWQRAADVHVNYLYAWHHFCAPNRPLAACLPPAPTLDDLASRTRPSFAVTFISNCGSWAWWWTRHRGNPRREFFFDFLQALNVVSPTGQHRVLNYGSCLHTPGLVEPRRGDQWASKISLFRLAKFALVFENNLRPDYLTEKLLHAVVAGALPVVWGAPEAHLFLPGGKSSYINALDFASPTALAEYLVFLDANHEAYLQYFQWRSQISATTGGKRKPFNSTRTASLAPAPSLPSSQAMKAGETFMKMTSFDFMGKGSSSFVCHACQAFLKQYC